MQNKFNIGEKVWVISYTPDGVFLEKYLVTGIHAKLTNIGSSMINIADCISDINYTLNQINLAADKSKEYLWEEDLAVNLYENRLFKTKAEAFQAMVQKFDKLAAELREEF